MSKSVENIFDTFRRFLAFSDLAPFRWPLPWSAELHNQIFIFGRIFPGGLCRRYCQTNTCPDYCLNRRQRMLEKLDGLLLPCRCAKTMHIRGLYSSNQPQQRRRGPAKPGGRVTLPIQGGAKVANPPASSGSLSGPPGPKSQKSLKRVSRASGPGVPKSLEKVSKESRTDIFETFSRLFGLFRDFFQTFWGPGPPVPGDSFQTFWGFRARRAQETPVARGRVRKAKGQRFGGGVGWWYSCGRVGGGGVFPWSS